MKKISVAPENPQYRIVEIFESLQGEGWNTGMPAVFVRLGKCNLACGWCDTDYLKFGMMSLSDILGRLKTYTARKYHHHRRRTDHTAASRYAVGRAQGGRLFPLYRNQRTQARAAANRLRRHQPQSLLRRQI